MITKLHIQYLAKFKYFILATLIGLPQAIFSADSVDIIITNDGESHKVYNIDISVDYCYYTSSPTCSDLKRIKNSDILIIRKADGSRIDPNSISSTSNELNNASSIIANPNQHAPVTIHSNSYFIFDKHGNQNIIIYDNNNNPLCLKKLSDSQNYLGVIRPIKGVKYKAKQYIIPEFVIITGTKYIVTEICEMAFFDNSNINKIIFPETLKIIRKKAFSNTGYLKNVILPESIETVEEDAFKFSGTFADTFDQLYIPETIKEIKANAFSCTGKKNQYTWKGYFCGNLTSMPSFITKGNCHDYGIDEEAVEEYLKRKQRNL